MTFNQLCKQGRWKRKRSVRNPLMSGYPQRAGICTKVFILPPKKPNSAKRKVVRVRLSNGKNLFAYVRGEGASINEFSKLLIHGGRPKDLPGVRNRVVKGKYDAAGVTNRRTSRSIYGTKKTSLIAAVKTETAKS